MWVLVLPEYETRVNVWDMGAPSAHPRAHISMPSKMSTVQLDMTEVPAALTLDAVPTGRLITSLDVAHLRLGADVLSFLLRQCGSGLTFLKLGDFRGELQVQCSNLPPPPAPCCDQERSVCFGSCSLNACNRPYA